MKIHFIKFVVERINSEGVKEKRVCVFDRSESFIRELEQSPDPVKYINDDYFRNGIDFRCIEYIGSFVSDENQMIGVVDGIPY